MVLWDLAKFYEHIDRDKLVQRALRAGYPTHLLMPAMRMAHATRWVSLGGYVQCAGHAFRGLLA
eukprot:5483461-Prorocentrum_lima.AAC.1